MGNVLWPRVTVNDTGKGQVCLLYLDGEMSLWIYVEG